MAMAGKKNSCFLARPENNFESKQTYFSYSPNKGFHAPEFQAKLFFTRNWVGGFYWDCLLKTGTFYQWEMYQRGNKKIEGKVMDLVEDLSQWGTSGGAREAVADGGGSWKEKC